MSTQQQALIMETILAMRRALKRKAYESDSDSSIDQHTNRGNKLKKRARFVRQGRLASMAGPAAYKEIAEHAGYQRAIISRNPPLIDEEGYDIESDDDEETIQQAVANAMEANPYADIRLEHILAPLTSVTDLPTHPTLSRPFTSKALSELVIQGRDLMQKENAALWRAKPLLTKLVGDNTWAPCGLMTAPDDQDALLFTDTTSFFTNRLRQPTADAAAAPKMNGDDTTNAANATEGAKQETTHAQPEAQMQKPDVQMDGTQMEERLKEPSTDGEAPRDERQEKNAENAPAANAGKPNGDLADDETEKADQRANGEPKPANAASADVEMTDPPAPNASEQANASAPSAQQQEQPPQPNAPAANNTSVIPNGLPNPFDDDEDPFIHPLFRLPPQAHPDRNFFLPEQEANEVRRLLLLYVQKQEEICRGARRLYEGLLRAERLRKTVWQWSKAEAHCGANRDMSDGEDWYDKEEWGLTEDLKKGEDEVEEDTQVVTKKTRNRK